MKKILRPWPALVLILLTSILTMLALSACKFGGGGGSSSSKTATPPPPKALQINAGNAQINAAWQPVQGATQYNLYYAKQPFTSLRNPPSGYRTLQGGAMAPNITTTSHTLTGLNNGTTYYLVLTAKNSSGESKISPQTSATPGQVGMTFQDALKNGGQGPEMIVLPMATTTTPAAVQTAPADNLPNSRSSNVTLPTGSFEMGSASTQTGRDRDEGPLRTVTISRSIAMSKHEVTFAEYQRFVNATSGQPRPADQGWGRDKRPVININWNQAKAYAAWLSAQTGKPYRLPSEAEWEYAARAGAATAYSWGDAIHCRQANYARLTGSSCNTDRNNTLARTLAVGRFAANAFGLHDLHGNVAEWVEDCWHNTYQNAPTDGRAWTTANNGDCAFRVIRGGAWNDAAPAVRAASRDTRALATTEAALGFRLVQDLNPQPPVPTTVPNAPTSLQASAGNAQATASWAAVSGAIAYTLYYSTSSLAAVTDFTAAGIIRVANLVGVSHTITGLTNGTTYYFRVTATNTIGQSTASLQTSTMPQAPASAPDAPASLQVSAGDARAVASWAAVAGASSYMLYYSTSSLDGVTNLTGSGITAVANLTGASATVTGLTNDTQYYFVVTATNAGGESAASSQASVTPQAVPDTPASPTLSPGNAQVQASWSAVTGATQYTLYYSTSSLANVTDLTAAGIMRIENLTGTSRTVTGLTNGRRYYFVITAANASGQSAASSEASTTPQAPPGAPANLSLTVGNAQVTASWSAVTGATGYTLYYATSSISDITASGVRSVSATSTSATVTGLTNSMRYHFVVTATNVSGESAASTEASATPQVPVPGAPTNLSLTAGNAQVAVSWTAVSGATEYTVYYSQSSISDISASSVRSVGTTGTSATVTGLTNGTQYYFKVTATNAGGESAASTEASATPQVPVPGAPTSLSLTAGNAQVAVSWTAVTGATEYTVYYSQSSISDLNASGVRSMNATGTSTTVTGLTNGTQYYFKVTATNAGGESAASTEASATPQVPVPGAPTNLSLTAGNAQVAVRWTAVSGATEYTVYYSQSSISDISASGVRSMNATGTSTTVTGLTNGTQYYFKVTATNAGGESAASSEASATPQVPVSGAPTNLSLTAGNAQVAVSWTAVNGATEYTVYYSQSSISDLNASGVRSMNATGTSTTVTGLTNGTQYYFKVTATNAGGEGAASTEASATPQVPVPGAPTGLGVTAGNAQVAVSWTVVSGATEYTVYYSQSSISDISASGVRSMNATSASATVTGLTNGTQYYFKVTATNAGGESAASSEASATPQVPVPGAPTNLSLTAGNAQVAVSWTAVSGATEYTVYYSQSSISDLNASGVRSMNATSASATVTGLTNGTQYYFKVTATNAGGESAASTEASATPQVPVPGAPTNLSLTAGNAQVAVRWTAVSGATEYTVYYSQSPISDISASGVRSVSATGTSTTVTGLTNGTQYYFKVTATNAGGESAVSTEASATPQVPVPGAPTGLGVTAGNAQVAVSWTVVNGATEYTVYYSQSSISDISASGVRSVSATGTSTTITGLTNGMQYYFKVTATNASGEGAASTEASATPQVPAPGAPTNLSLTAGNAQVEVSWTAVSGATGYTVYYSQSSISDISASGVRSMNATGTSTTVTGLTNGMQYYFKVTATNAGGEGAASSEASATPQMPPGAPTNLSLMAGNAQVAASWTAVSGATEYTVYYSQSSISDISASGVRSVSATGTSTTVTGLTNRTRYYFKVTATNAGGESAASSEASATPQVPAPGAPTNLSLTAGNAQVAVRWTAVSGATGYTVYYSQSTISDISASSVRSVGTTNTSATVTGLTNSTLYYFKVTAINAGGESAASTEASATPRVPAPGAPTNLSLTAGNAQVAVSWTAVNGATGYTVYYSQSSISDISASGVRSMNATSASATVTGLTNGTLYYFKVTATNAGGESAASTEVSATPQVPVTLPGAPTGFSLAADNARVTASWVAVTNASSYTLYYTARGSISDLTASGITQVPNIRDTSITINALSNGLRYYFVVTASNTVGQSTASAGASAMPQASTVEPDAPGGLSLVANARQVAVRWAAVSGAGSYTLYYSKTSLAGVNVTNLTETQLRSRNITRAANITSTSTTITGLDNGDTYYFVVTASNTVGQSAASAQASVIPNIPGPLKPSGPSGFSVSAGNRGVTLNWNAVSDAIDYILYYSESPITDINASGVNRSIGIRRGNFRPSWPSPTLTNGTRYYFVIMARGSIFGESALSFQTSATPQAPVSGAPGGLSLSAGNAQVTASWTAVSGATGYTLYYSQSPITSLTGSGIGSVTANGTSATATGLTNGRLYYFVVTATSAGGQSAASNEASTTPQAPVPAAPLSAPSLRVSAGNAQVTASWQAVSGATEYTLYYTSNRLSLTPTSLRADVQNQRLTNVRLAANITDTSHTITGLANGVTYYFVVIGNNAGGHSPVSIQVSATPKVPLMGVGPGTVFRDALLNNGIQGPEMVVLPTGSFQMGSATTETGHAADEGPMHTVTISKRIAMSKYEVTFADYDQFVVASTDRRIPSPRDEGWGRGARPVINVSDTYARDYAAWLSAQTGKNYRLPTEKEWEYAARAGAGTSTRYSWGNNILCSQANFTQQAVLRAPTNLSLTAGDARVTASWDAPHGATGYTLYYSQSPISEITASGVSSINATGATATVTGLTNGTRYYFRVIAATRAGDQSPASNEASATPSALVSGVPANLSLTSGNAQVTASWTAVNGATRYTVYYSQSSISDITAASVRSVRTTGTSTTITRLTNDTQYYFRVMASSTVSVEVSATPQAPVTGAPRNLRLTAGDGRVAARWSAVRGATGYILYYATSPLVSTTDFTGVNAVRVTSTSVTATGLTNGTLYYFAVSATSAGSASAASNEVSAAPRVSAGASRNLNYCNRRSTVFVGQFAANPFGLHDMHGNVSEWVTGCGGGRGAYDNYSRRPFGRNGRPRGGNCTQSNTARGGSWGSSPATLRSANRIYDVRSRLDASRTRGFRLVQDLNVPSAPGSFRLIKHRRDNLRDITKSRPQRYETLDASWRADPNIATHTLYYSQSSLAGINVQNLTAAQLTARGITRTDIGTSARAPGRLGPAYALFGLPSNLTSGTRYYAVLTASNAHGESAPSAQGFVTPGSRFVARPAAPTNLTARSDSVGRVTISWDRVVAASAYDVYYSTSSLDGVNVRDLTTAQLATRGITRRMIDDVDDARYFPATRTETIFYSLTSNTRYYFVVTASNAVGESASSDQVSVMPQRLSTSNTPYTSPTPIAGNGQVTVDWQETLEGPNRYSASSYNLYYSQAPIVSLTGSGVTRVAKINNTAHTITGLTNGVTYYFKVAGNNADGTQSLSSNEASISLQVPAPGSPGLVTGNAQVTVIWHEMTSADSYTVYYSQAPITSLTASSVTAVPNLTATSHTVTALNNGTQYYFVVTATNAGGQGAASPEVSATPQAAP